MKKRIIQAIKEDRLDSYIISNYHLMSKEDLKDLIIELDYICYRLSDNKGDREKGNDMLIEEVEAWI